MAGITEDEIMAVEWNKLYRLQAVINADGGGLCEK